MQQITCFSTCDRFETKICWNHAREGLQKVVSRKFIIKSTKKVYYDEVSGFIEKVAETDNQIALTVDDWKFSNRTKLFGITCHFHNNNLELNNYSIGFEEVSNMKFNTGEVLVTRFLKVFMESKIEKHILFISRDSSGAMNTLLDDFIAHYKT